MRYAVIDIDGTVVNVIVWDGVTPYDPGEGLTLVPMAEDSTVGPGDVIPAP
jgi:hypothetical protein